MNQSINKLLQVKYIDKNKKINDETINCEINYDIFLDKVYNIFSIKEEEKDFLEIFVCYTENSKAILTPDEYNNFINYADFIINIEIIYNSEKKLFTSQDNIFRNTVIDLINEIKLPNKESDKNLIKNINTLKLNDISKENLSNKNLIESFEEQKLLNYDDLSNNIKKLNNELYEKIYNNLTNKYNEMFTKLENNINNKINDIKNSILNINNNLNDNHNNIKNLIEKINLENNFKEIKISNGKFEAKYNKIIDEIKEIKKDFLSMTKILKSFNLNNDDLKRKNEITTLKNNNEQKSKKNFNENIIDNNINNDSNKPKYSVEYINSEETIDYNELEKNNCHFCVKFKNNGNIPWPKKSRLCFIKDNNDQEEGLYFESKEINNGIPISPDFECSEKILIKKQKNFKRQQEYFIPFEIRDENDNKLNYHQTGLVIIKISFKSKY